MPEEASPESTKVHPKSSTTPEDHLGRGVAPPSAFPDLQPGSGSGSGAHGRNRSLGGMSAKTTGSAARPDSLIMPFEDFVTSLDMSRAATPVDDPFGPK
jgi:hypothetical protein